MSHENSNTFINHGNNSGSENFNENYDYMMEVKDGYKTDTNDKNFPEALKQDARTQLAIIDDIENKFKNAIPPDSTGGRIKRKTKKSKRTQTKRKRRSNKRRSTKRKH